eukprot:3938489-Rhodomonas_salina.1
MINKNAKVCSHEEYETHNLFERNLRGQWKGSNGNCWGSNTSLLLVQKAGAGRLAGVLRECKALTHFLLTCNRLGDEGAGSLAG